MDYKARYYDPRLGRFLSVDSIVPNPGAPIDLNRYAYTRNNPMRYRDPSGHYVCEDAYGHCRPPSRSEPPLPPTLPTLPTPGPVPTPPPTPSPGLPSGTPGSEPSPRQTPTVQPRSATPVQCGTPVPTSQSQTYSPTYYGGRLDGIGWRFDVSGGTGLATDANLDFVWNS
jgi:hypothetical protein